MNNRLFRLPQGGEINREKPIRFSFNGKRYSGFEGDTLASALLANGVKILGRSFKYHRPRGLFSAGIEECNAIVQLDRSPDTEPNVRATMLPISEGLQAFSQSCWPSVNWDVFSVLGWFSRFLPPGFYYKTFKWPSWKIYEPLIRHTAGMGVAPTTSDKQSYTKRFAHCDVLVVGGGVAGFSAALAAARGGARVMLVEEHECFGGALLRDREIIDSAPAAEWLESAVRELQGYGNVQMVSRCTATGFYDHNLLVMVEHLPRGRDLAGKDTNPVQRLWKVRAKQVVLATGAIERPLVFPNNDRPGVMLAAGVRTYIKRYATAPGAKLTIYTNNSDAYRTALEAHTAGIEVAAIIDARNNPAGTWVEKTEELGIKILAGSRVANTKGYSGLRSVLVECPADGTGKTWIDCDVLAMSGGWTPSVHLYSQNGGKLHYSEESACFLPEQAENVHCVGSLNGRWTLAECLQDGNKAGILAARRAGFEPTYSLPAAGAEPIEVGSLMPVEPRLDEFPGKQWVDHLYDVTVADVNTAAREEFLSIEHFKRYTTTGMAVDQGKTSNVNALSLLAQITGRNIPEVGTTKFRPPYTPVTFGTLAGYEVGELYLPRREMPCHHWHESNGAHFDDVGTWQRPACYPMAGESHADAITREILAVRNAVGIFEGSPLGKIEVRGSDAAEFLHRIYMNNVHSLELGKIRYALMLNDAGVVMDDGVFCKLAENHFLLYPTSAAADRVGLWLEEWSQTAWPDLDVVISIVSEQWATCTVSGPKARVLMQSLDSDINFAGEAFPHMSYRTGTLFGVPSRISRVSFTGEVSYEINVPASYGEGLWDVLVEEGKPFDITPYGGEALLTLRLEKGYLHVGGDTDGTTIPDDIGWGGVAMKKESDYVGKRSLSLPVNIREGRFQLVGYELLDGKGTEFIEVGAHVVKSSVGERRLASIGYVTSACFSPTLNKPVAIGRMENGRARKGEVVEVYSNGKTSRAKVVEPIFYDPQGDRVNG